jgi:hypothetical protein
MKGLIIIDGPDASGKTTLAKQLCKLHGGTYLHLTYRFKDKMLAYQWSMLQKAVKLAETQLVVIDRLWMSELCYANAYRAGKSSINNLWRAFDQMVLKAGGVYIFCLPKDIIRHNEVFHKEHSAKGEMFSEMLPVAIEYHKMWEKVKTWPHVLRYDVFIDGQPEYLPGFISQIEEKVQQGIQYQLELTTLSETGITGNLGTAEYVFIMSEPVTDLRQLEVTCSVLDEVGIPNYEIMTLVWNKEKFLLDKLIRGYNIKPIVFDQKAWVEIIRKYQPEFGGSIVRRLNYIEHTYVVSEHAKLQKQNLDQFRLRKTYYE